ncbi:MAG: putative Ig domain-containing protein [Synergistaceae bacterium]|nr:putative Ig domain-containing protein [Synergistaceae bacterium]
MKKYFAGSLAVFLCVLLMFAGKSYGEVFGWPTPGYTSLSTTYYYPDGTRHACRYYYGGRAAGVDIRVSTGTEIFAPAAGTVQSLEDLTVTHGPKYSFGKYFEIKHDNGTVTLYAHLSEFKVSNGQRVNRGDLIALSGNTGNTTGPHLHYEMSDRDTYQYYQENGYIDPRTIDDSPKPPEPSSITITTDSNLPGTTKGTYFYKRLECTGEGSTAWSRVSGAFPPGIDINPNTGEVHGYSQETGNFRFVIKAENRSGSDIKEFRITVSEGRDDPPIEGSKITIKTDSEITDGEAGSKGYDVHFSCTGNGNSWWEKIDGDFPPNLEFDRSGRLYGEFSSQTGTYTFTLRASNDSGSAVKKFTLTVREHRDPFVFGGNGFTDGKEGGSYSRSVSVSGGASPYKLEYGGNIPEGLIMTASGNQFTLSGIPSKAGTYSFSIKASDNEGRVITNNCTVKIEAPVQYNAPSITTGSLPKAAKDSDYSASITAEGDNIAWSVSGLPEGLAFDAGKISGIPSESGTFTVTVTASNQGGTVSKMFTLTVDAPDQKALETEKWAIENGKLTVETNGTPTRWEFDPSDGTNGHGFKIPGEFPAGLTVHLPENWELHIWTSNDESRITVSDSSRVRKGEEAGLPDGAVSVTGSNDITLNVEDIEMTAWSLDVLPGVTKTETKKWAREDGKLIVETDGTPSRYEFSPITSPDTNGDGFRISGDFPAGLVISLPYKWGIDVDTSYAVTVSDESKIIPADKIPGLPETAHRIMGGNTITLSAPGIVMTAFIFTSPAITTAESLGTFSAGGDISLQLEAEGTKWSMKWTASGLTEGLSLNADTGLLSGKISSAGDYSFKVTATNCAGEDTRTFTLKVKAHTPAAKAPTIMTARNLPDGFYGMEYKYQLKADEPVTAWTLAQNSKPLPEGLELDPETGIIEGETTAAGTYNFTVTAANDAGTSNPKAFKITVKPSSRLPRFKPDTLKAAKWGKSYNASMKAENMRVTSWDVGGYIPEGLTFSKGKFSGRPMQADVFGLTISATNGAVTITQDYTLTVDNIPPRLKGSLKPSGKEGTFYKSVLKASGTTPMIWHFSALPEGVSYDVNEDGTECVVSGIPSGEFDKKITVTVSNGEDNEDEITKPMRLKISAAAPKFETKPSDAPTWTAGEYSEFQVKLSVSPSEVLWTLGGNVPNGIEIDPDSGLIYGVPATAGKNYKLIVTAANAKKTTLKKTLTLYITVNPAENSEPGSSVPSDSEAAGDSPVSGFNDGIACYERGELTAEMISRVYDAGEIIAAVLPAVEADDEGWHYFTVSLDISAPEGGLMVWHSFPDDGDDSEDADTYFADCEDNIIERVPDSLSVNVWAWLKPGKIYEPVITVRVRD